MQSPIVTDCLADFLRQPNADGCRLCNSMQCRGYGDEQPNNPVHGGRVHYSPDKCLDIFKAGGWSA